MLFSVLNPAYGWSILFIVFVRIATSIGGAYENLYFIERGRVFGFSKPRASTWMSHGPISSWP